MGGNPSTVLVPFSDKQLHRKVYLYGFTHKVALYTPTVHFVYFAYTTDI